MELTTNKPKEVRQARDWHARRACDDARALERAGDYEGARSALGKLWTRIGERPQLDQLPPDTQAEVLWRVGSLSGWLGSANQIPGAQEFARDLLTESITLFESLDQQDKRAEAMGDLALCYWRSGAQDEGRALFGQAVEAAEKPEIKLRTLINASQWRFLRVVMRMHLDCSMLQRLFSRKFRMIGYTVAYHYQRGLVYKNLGGTENLDRALIEYSAATMHLGNAGHIRHLAGVENNIGFALLLLGRATEALTHLDKARAIFVSLKDTRMVAQVNETRARVFLAEKRLPRRNARYSRPLQYLSRARRFVTG